MAASLSLSGLAGSTSSVRSAQSTVTPIAKTEAAGMDFGAMLRGEIPQQSAAPESESSTAKKANAETAVAAGEKSPNAPKSSAREVAVAEAPEGAVENETTSPGTPAATTATKPVGEADSPEAVQPANADGKISNADVEDVEVIPETTSPPTLVAAGVAPEEGADGLTGVDASDLAQTRLPPPSGELQTQTQAELEAQVQAQAQIRASGTVAAATPQSGANASGAAIPQSTGVTGVVVPGTVATDRPLLAEGLPVLKSVNPVLVAEAHQAGGSAAATGKADGAPNPAIALPANATLPTDSKVLDFAALGTELQQSGLASLITAATTADTAGAPQLQSLGHLLGVEGLSASAALNRADMLSTTAAASSTAAAALSASIDTQKAGWLPSLAAELIQLRDMGDSRVRINLAPAHLGQINCELTDTARGIELRVVTDSAAARDLMQDNNQDLRQRFEQAGLMLAGFHCETGRGSGRGDAQAEFANTPMSGLGAGDENLAPAQPVTQTGVRLLDLYA